MSKHTKIIFSERIVDIPEEVDEEAKITYVVRKGTKYGVFDGEVKVASEDREYENSLIGYRFAERKCDIQAQEKKCAMFRERKAEVEHLLNVAIEKYHGEGETVNFLKRQLSIAIRDYDYEKKEYLYMRDGYSDYTERVLKDRKKVLDKYGK